MGRLHKSDKKNIIFNSKNITFCQKCHFCHFWPFLHLLKKMFTNVRKIVQFLHFFAFFCNFLQFFFAIWPKIQFLENIDLKCVEIGTK